MRGVFSASIWEWFVFDRDEMIQRLRNWFTENGLGAVLVRSLAGSAGLRIVGMLFGFLVGIQLARGLGAEGYGVYGIAMAIISLLTIPTEFGLPQLITREVAAAQVRDDGNLIRDLLSWADRTVLALSLVVAGVALAGWFFFGGLFAKGVSFALLAGLPLVPLIALGNLRCAAVRGLQQVVRGQIPEVVLRPVVFSALLLSVTLFYPLEWSPALAMIMQVVAAAAALFASAYLLNRLLPQHQRASVSMPHPKKWLSSAVPMALTEGMRVLHGNISLLLLGAFSSSAVVGVFRVSSSMGLLLTMPVGLLHVVCAPIFSRLYAQNDQEKLQRMLTLVAVAMVAGVMAVTFPFVFWGEELLIRVFGAEFGPSNLPMLILSAGVIIGCAFGAGATLLNMTGHERRVTRAFGLSLLALGVLSPPLIELWGAVGAAYANSFAFVMWSALMWVDARRLLKLDTSIAQLVPALFPVRT